MPSELANIEIEDFTRDLLMQVLGVHNIGVDFELTTIPRAMAMLSRLGEVYFEITEDGYLRFALLHRPTTFTINSNVDSRIELARLQIYLERGSISLRQFNAIRSEILVTTPLQNDLTPTIPAIPANQYEDESSGASQASITETPQASWDLEDFISGQIGNGVVEVSRRTDTDRRGIYIVTFVPPAALQNIETELTRETLIQTLGLNGLPADYELTTLPGTPSQSGTYFEITEDGYLSFALLHRPATFTINRNIDQRTELARLQIYFERGNITLRQFNAIRSEIIGGTPLQSGLTPTIPTPPAEQVQEEEALEEPSSETDSLLPWELDFDVILPWEL